MSKDKEYSTNSEVKRSTDFQNTVSMKEKVVNAIKQLLQSTTDEQFKAVGIVKNEKFGGVYGDKTKYGAGAVENKYIVKIAGKTKTNLTKEIIWGAKNVISVINIAYNSDMITVEYKSPESGFFRGIDRNGNSFMINEKIVISAKDIEKFKAEIKKYFDYIAKREIAYLTDTKLGTEDKTEKSTTSTVDESFNKLKMKKLTIKDLYSEELSPNIKPVQKQNTVPLKKIQPGSNSDKEMFLDNKDEDIKNEITTAGPAGSGAGKFDTKMNEKDSVFKRTPYAQKNEKKPTITKDWKVVSEKDKKGVEKNSEIKSTGKDVDVSVKKQNSNPVMKPQSDINSNPQTGNKEYKSSNQSKAPTSSKDGFWEEVKLIPGTGYVPVGMDKNYIAGMHNASKSDISKKGYSEGKNKNGNILNESAFDIKSNDEYIRDIKAKIKTAKENGNTEEVNKLIKQLKDYAEIETNGGHELGENNIAGQTHKQPDLSRKKFFSLAENEHKNINKRYLITEKTSDEYERERWKKLSSFKTYESIKEAEEMNEFFDSIKNNSDITKSPIYTKKNLTENVSHDDIFTELKKSVSNNTDENETVLVQKPNSKFEITYKFFKKDFLNENKKYILDLNSKTFVPNPNNK